MTMHGVFVEKADACLAAITGDPRWDLQDELLFQVAAFTWYGYCFGIGRTLYFLDADEIDAHVIARLTGWVRAINMCAVWWRGRVRILATRRRTRMTCTRSSSASVIPIFSVATIAHWWRVFTTTTRC